MLQALVLCSSGLAFAESDDSVPTLRFSTASLPPVTTPAGDGYLDQLLDALFSRLGMCVEIQKLPPARGLAQANAGLLDGEAARINLDGSLYPALHRMREPLFDVVFAGLYTRPDVSVDALEDFFEYRLGFVRGWKIAESLFSEHSMLIRTHNATQLFDMLDAGRIDIAFMTVAPGRFIARGKGIEHLQVTGFTLRKDLHLYMHEKNIALLPALSAALKSMKADGSYGDIMDDYERENR
ncbi:MAG: transporter substrate-binding domain-containing protein [Granulosicoccus sp.]|nr:transporter substrate-binding domain-containing protein [Granulosicoccus sp.]